jgi:predicted TPR repeat methyltransferase
MAYEQYLSINPDDAEIIHILTALKDEPAPLRMPDASIQHLYKRFSKFYESNVVDELGYVAPQKITEAVGHILPENKKAKTLDLGCGTGLSGKELKQYTSSLTGIDLSPEMLEQARSRKIYDTLEAVEMTAWLESAQQQDQNFDLIVACDSLIYFGDLNQIITPAASLLTEHGIIAFSVERGLEYPYHLADSGRYTHHIKHIQEVAENCSLSISHHCEEFLRMEYGQEVIGHIVVLQRKEQALSP